MIKLIMTDLDGTLLRSDKSISDYSVSILKKCQSKGIKVIFATARSIQAVTRIFGAFIPDAFIGYGGALALSGDTIIHRVGIPADVSGRLIRECLHTPEITSIFAINESVALTNNLSELEAKDSSHYQYSDFSSNGDLSFLKISATATNPSAVEHIASHFPMCDMLRYTGENLYRFSDRNAVKWSAAKAVAEYFDVSTDALAAFGDDKNDFEMVKYCGMGVAVENAIDEVKAAAKYICGSNDHDGVARWLEEYLPW